MLIKYLTLYNYQFKLHNINNDLNVCLDLTEYSVLFLLNNFSNLKEFTIY